MGTHYELIDPKEAYDGAELTIIEQSNLLDLSVFNNNGECTTLICNASPEVLLNIAIKIIQVCLYWVLDPKEVRGKIAKEIGELPF